MIFSKVKKNIFNKLRNNGKETQKFDKKYKYFFI